MQDTTSHVELSSEGLFVYKWHKRRQIKKRVKKQSVCSQLRNSCKIAEGTTLIDIFNIVDSYRLLKIVISQYSWCREIDAFHAQANEFHEIEEEDEKMSHLEIYHHVETNQSDERIKHPGGLRERIKVVDFQTYPSFGGRGPEPVNQNYSISYSPMWKLAHLPVKINEDFDVYTAFDPSSKKKPEKVLTTKRDFSLLEVLDAIYWDISFMGGPDANAAFMCELDERVSEIKSGDVAGIPLEQLRKRLGMEPTEESTEEDGENKFKVILHPDVAQFFGVNPDDIPLDDKEIMRPPEKEENNGN